MTYRDVLARNVRAIRATQRIGQQDLAARMRALGFDSWLHQTVGNVERGKRRITAEEVLGLALALQSSITALMTISRDDHLVELPAGQLILARTVYRSLMHYNDGMVWWEGNEPHFLTQEPETWPDTELRRSIEHEMHAQALREFGASPEDTRARDARIHPPPAPAESLSPPRITPAPPAQESKQ